MDTKNESGSVDDLKSDDGVGGQAEEGSTSRAREPQTRGERVRYIADVMASDEWPIYGEGAAYRRKLAARWGCAEATIRDYAAEASRSLELDEADKAALRQRLANRFKAIADDAETRTNKQTELPDYASTLKALDLHAKYAGIDIEQKVKVDATVNGIADLLGTVLTSRANDDDDEVDAVADTELPPPPDDKNP